MLLALVGLSEKGALPVSRLLEESLGAAENATQVLNVETSCAILYECHARCCAEYTIHSLSYMH